MSDKTLEKLRKKIDKCDKNICKQLVDRFSVVQKIKVYKKLHNIAILDPKRESVVKSKARNLVGKKMPTNSVENIFNTIMDETKKAQKK
ncbi:MAG: chorismate mutase [Mycoplasmataceae bacterium]|nr:chorismate mutase [Mycoplasmataceae bacterium]